MGGIAPKGRTGPEAVPLPDGHFAGAAVETEFEAAAVVEEEERAGVLCPLETGAEAEFETDAVFAAHQFGSGGVGEFIGVVNDLGAPLPIGPAGQGVGDIRLVIKRFYG